MAMEQQKVEQAAGKSMGVAVDGFTAASKNFQTLATEVAKMSMDSYEQANRVIEQMRGVKSMDELIAIQTNFLKQCYEQFTSRSQRLAEIMSTIPRDMGRSYQEMLSQSTEAFSSVARTASDTVREATEQSRSVGEQVTDRTTEASRRTGSR